MAKKFDIVKLPIRVGQLNAAILQRLSYIIEQYEIYTKSFDVIPKELNNANNSLNRLLNKRITLIKRYAQSDIKLSNFSEVLGVLAQFPQEIQYLLFRRKELINDRRLFRRYHAYINSRDKHNELEEKRKILTSSIESLSVTELDRLIECLMEI